MAKMKFYNVDEKPAATSPEGTYYVKSEASPDTIRIYVVSKGAVKETSGGTESGGNAVRTEITANASVLPQTYIKSFLVYDYKVEVLANETFLRRNYAGPNHAIIDGIPLDAGQSYVFISPHVLEWDNAGQKAPPVVYFIVSNEISGFARGFRYNPVNYTAKQGDKFYLLVKYPALDFSELGQGDLLIIKGANAHYGQIPQRYLRDKILRDYAVVVNGSRLEYLAWFWQNNGLFTLKLPLVENVEYTFTSPHATLPNHPFIIYNSSTNTAVQFNTNTLTYNAVAGDTFFMRVKQRLELDFSEINETDLKITGVWSDDSIIYTDLQTIIADRCLFAEKPESGTKNIQIFDNNGGFINLENVNLSQLANPNFVVYYTERLESGFMYEFDSGQVLTSAAVAVLVLRDSTTNNPIRITRIAVGGRRRTVFETPPEINASHYVFYFNAFFDRQPGWVERDAYDIRSTAKLTRLTRSRLNVFNFKSPVRLNTPNDLSEQKSIKIERPEFIHINLVDDYMEMTKSRDWSINRQYIEYRDSNGVYFRKPAQTGGQGTGSMGYTNRNAKFRFFNEDGTSCPITIGDWLPVNQFHYKVNWVDFSHTLNLGGARFVHEWYNDDPDKKKPYEKPYSRATSTFEETFWNGARCVVDGIASILTVCGNHWCNGQFNLRPFADNYNLKSSNPNHMGFRGGLGAVDNKSTWEEMVTGTEGVDMPDSKWLVFLDYINWFNNNKSPATVQAFKDADGIKFDIIDLIDYYLYMQLCIFIDNYIANNMVWVTYDGVKFTPLWYDMDTQLGMTWNGMYTYAPNNNFAPINLWWEQLLRAYPAEMAERYRDLRRKGIFSTERFLRIYGGIIEEYKFEYYDLDRRMWDTYGGQNAQANPPAGRPSMMTGNLISKSYIKWWMTERLAFMDAKYNYTP